MFKKAEMCKDKSSIIKYIIKIWAVKVILIFTTTTCVSANPPVILQTGNKLWYRVGDRLVLECQGDGPLIWDHSQLRNLDTDTRVNSTSELVKGKYLSTLTVGNLSLIDSGLFFCMYDSSNLSGFVAIEVKVSTGLLLSSDSKSISKLEKAGLLSMFIVLCLISYLGPEIFRRWKRPRKQDSSKINSAQNIVTIGIFNPDEAEPWVENHTDNIYHLDPELSINDQADLLKLESHWEFPRDHLQLGADLGSGAYGRVVKAEALGLLDTEPSTTVAVKMAKSDAGEVQSKALMCELKIMAHLGKGTHVNVVNLVGACTVNLSQDSQFLVIVEYCKHGSLLNYIRRYKECFVNQIIWDSTNNAEVVNPSITETGSNFIENGIGPCTDIGHIQNSSIADHDTTNRNSQRERILHRNFSGRKSGGITITTTDLLCWAFQIAKGMEYLASRKVIHGDLAARNVLLTDYNIVKICDFGLAKEVYKDYKYIMSTNGGHFPVKWMAIESIYYGELSTKSDCWSFGVVLWEMFSLGKIPYSGMKANDELIKEIDKGYRMGKPEHAPSSMYKMMTACWAREKGERPLFSELVDRIGCMMDKKLRHHFIELNVEYVRRNQIYTPVITTEGQNLPQLDTSYGYLKPIRSSPQPLTA